MARFFIPNLSYRPGAGKDISADVLFALEQNLPKDAAVCVGFTAGHREVDLAIFTNVTIHVIESKDYYTYPVRFFKNQGLCVMDASGAWQPIINDRGAGEYVNVQASKNASAVHWDLNRDGKDLQTCSYILIPHFHPDSSVSDNGDFTRICLGTLDLLDSIKNREEMLRKKGRANGCSPEMFVDIAQRVFNLHETDTINGYKIGDPAPIIDVTRGQEPVNGSAYAAGKAFGRLFQGLKLPGALSAGQKFLMMALFVFSVVLTVGGFLGFFLSIAGPMIFGHFSSKISLIFFIMAVAGMLLRGSGVLSIIVSLLLGKRGTSQVPAQPGDISSSIQDKSIPIVTQRKSSIWNILVRFFRSLPRGLKILIRVVTAVIVLVMIASLFNSQRVCVTGSNLNVRPNPNTSGTPVETLRAGACLQVNGKSYDGKWLRVGGFPYGGNWISAGFVDGLHLDKLKTVY